MASRQYHLLYLLLVLFSLSLFSPILALPSTELEARPRTEHHVDTPTVSDNVDDELVLRIIEVINATPSSQVYDVDTILDKVNVALRSAVRLPTPLPHLSPAQATHGEACVPNPLSMFKDIVISPTVQCTTIEPAERVSIEDDYAKVKCATESPFLGLFAPSTSTPALAKKAEKTKIKKYKGDECIRESIFATLFSPTQQPSAVATRPTLESEAPALTEVAIFVAPSTNEVALTASTNVPVPEVKSLSIFVPKMTDLVPAVPAPTSPVMLLPDTKASVASTSLMVIPTATTDLVPVFSAPPNLESEEVVVKSEQGPEHEIVTPDPDPLTSTAHVDSTPTTTGLVEISPSPSPAPEIADKDEFNPEVVTPVKTFQHTVKSSLTPMENLQTNGTLAKVHGLEVKTNQLKQHGQRTQPVRLDAPPYDVHNNSSIPASPQPSEDLSISTPTTYTYLRTRVIPIVYELTINNIYLDNFFRPFMPWRWSYAFFAQMWAPHVKYNWLSYVVMVTPSSAFLATFTWKLRRKEAAKVRRRAIRRERRMAAKASKRALKQLARARVEAVSPTCPGFSISMDFAIRGMSAFKLERYLDEVNASEKTLRNHPLRINVDADMSMTTEVSTTSRCERDSTSASDISIASVIHTSSVSSSGDDSSECPSTPRTAESDIITVSAYVQDQVVQVVTTDAAPLQGKKNQRRRQRIRKREAECVMLFETALPQLDQL